MENHKELTLAYINGYRAAKGLAPLSEFPENIWKPSESRSMTCPITKGLEVEAYAGGYVVDSRLMGALPVGMPEYVLETEKEFDRTKKTVK